MGHKHKKKEVDDDTFDPLTQRRVQVVYLVSAIVWIIIVYVFYLYSNNIIVWLLLIIPLIIFGLNYYWVPQHSRFVANLMFSADFLSIGFLIVTIIINWYKEVDKGSIFGLIVLSLALFGFSMIDVWVSEENFIIVQHIRSALETAAVITLIIVVYKYYLEVQKEVYFA